MGECVYQSQQMQQQQQTMMTDIITSSPNIPILRPSVSRNLQCSMYIIIYERQERDCCCRTH